MKAVYKITLFLHFLNCFFLLFAPPFFFNLALHSRIFLSCLSRFSLVITILLGWMTMRFLQMAFLPVNLEDFANLLPFVILLDGHELNIVRLPQLFENRSYMWENVLKWFLWVLLWSEVTKELNFIFGCCCLNDGHKRAETISPRRQPTHLVCPASQESLHLSCKSGRLVDLLAGYLDLLPMWTNWDELASQDSMQP